MRVPDRALLRPSVNMTGGHRKDSKQALRDDKEPLKYLRDTPPVFKEIADVLLILDSGEELPTHRCVALLSHEISSRGSPLCHDECSMPGAGRCSP